VLGPLRARSPKAYTAVIEHIRAFVNTMPEERDD
jgi:hypothetical protein